MKKISDWAKVLLPLVGSGMVLHYLFYGTSAATR